MVEENKKKKIIDELLKDAPPGQVKQVLSDVKTLVGDDALVKEVAEKTIKAYDLQHLTQATYKDEGTERKFLICSHGELSSEAGVCSYLDPSTKKCVDFDHLGQKCDSSSAREATEDELKRLSPKGDKNTEELRQNIQDELSKSYMKDNYPHGTCAVYDISSDGKAIVICISSTVYKPRSYWSGRWTSEWNLVGKENGNFSLEGKSDVTTHYYENGNVQFRSSRTFEKKDLGVKSNHQDLSAVVKAVKKHISEEEFHYQEDLQESLREFAETTFKKLRRQLPLTQLTFPWTTGAASLATELVQRGKGK